MTFCTVETSGCNRPLPMTIETPPHRHLLHLLEKRHRFDGTMTLLAGDLSHCDMLAMIEVGKVREAVDLYPFDRPVFFDCLLYLSDFRRICFDFFVTIHADGGRRNSSVPALFRPKVAIETGDLVVAGMNLVRIGDRLHRLVVLTGAGKTNNSRKND